MIPDWIFMLLKEHAADIIGWFFGTLLLGLVGYVWKAKKEQKKIKIERIGDVYRLLDEWAGELRSYQSKIIQLMYDGNVPDLIEEVKDFDTFYKSNLSKSSPLFMTAKLHQLGDQNELSKIEKIGSIVIQLCRHYVNFNLKMENEAFAPNQGQELSDESRDFNKHFIAYKESLQVDFQKI